MVKILRFLFYLHMNSKGIKIKNVKFPTFIKLQEITIPRVVELNIPI